MIQLEDIEQAINFIDRIAKGGHNHLLYCMDKEIEVNTNDEEWDPLSEENNISIDFDDERSTFYDDDKDDYESELSSICSDASDDDSMFEFKETFHSLDILDLDDNTLGNIDLHSPIHFICPELVFAQLMRPLQSTATISLEAYLMLRVFIEGNIIASLRGEPNR
jgi:hypothetical protein